eukprot:CAMPEP_0206256784 /NCGR_PEP_ID=MMETSP0047_2-20121206/24974_1 /ASSEMBLY_ACC=CAM_ASM_000192 /TAXON_ID=195065 /ORGANISM="Chroomonas mesostigmatica_cf, Strain CCMP1168" /LENGTH=293 /DNA_ID=CAMNT_0053683291 /DNA_START=58 /DNA_END=936 /DNA_ORIENTATION=+
MAAHTSLQAVFLLAAALQACDAFLAPGRLPLKHSAARGAALGRPGSRGLLAKEGGDAATQPRWRGPGDPTKEIKVYKPSLGDDIVDDLTGKRFGNGWAFYGERERLKDKDYDALAKEAEEAAMYRPERPDSVLVLGATGKVGEWITLKILENDVNTRIMARNFDKAEAQFGRDGSNLDIYVGDVKSVDDLDNACEDAKAVVFCAGARIPFGADSFENVDVGGMKNLLEIVKRYPSIKRIIMISSEGDYGIGGGLKTRRQAEDLLRAQSDVNYAIVRVPRLWERPGREKMVKIE